MKPDEKIKILQDQHFGVWLKTRQQTDDELSQKQTMFCVCGKLATGLHEGSCRRFNQLVDRKTMKKLEHLIGV